MKTLSSRQLEILKTGGGLSRTKVLTYVHVWLRDGYAIPSELRPPDWELGTVPAVSNVTNAPSVAPGITEEEAFTRWDCVFRQVTEEKHECKPCRGARLHSICHCEKFDQACIVRGHDRKDTLTCMTCDDRKDPVIRTTRKPMVWCMGMLTAPRRNPSIDAALLSYHSAGFDEIHIYAEPGSTRPTSAPHVWIEREYRHGCWRNTVQALRDMWARNPKAEAYALFQDDCVMMRDVRTFLEHDLWPSPTAGLVSIYSPDWSGYEDKNIKGIRMIKNNYMMGACGVILSNPCLNMILNHPLSKDWRGTYRGRQDNPEKKAASDTWFSTVVREGGFNAFVYSPSLMQHFARFSALGHGSPDKLGSNGRWYRKSVLFPGENISALEYFRDSHPLVRWGFAPHLHQRWAESAHMPLKLKVSIVIPGWESPDLTLRCLDHIRRQNVELKVIYVDNGSCEETKQKIRDHATDLGLEFQMIENATNLGYTKATNQGIEAAEPNTHVLLLNNDCFLATGALEKLRWHIEWHRKIAAVGPLTGDRGGQSVIHSRLRNSMKLGPGIVHVKDDPEAAMRICGGISRILPVDTLSGFCMLMNAKAVAELGKLSEDPGFRQGLGTDDEWILRAKKAGWSAIVVSNAYAAHIHSESFRRLGIDRRSEQNVAGATLKRYFQ